MSAYSSVLSPEPEVRRRLTPSLRGRATFAVLLLTVAALSLLYLRQTNDLASVGYDVAALQQQQLLWQMRNEQLQLQVEQLQSLDRVDQVASSRLRLGPPTREVFVTVPGS
jgi:cell division protein FtsL